MQDKEQQSSEQMTKQGYSSFPLILIIGAPVATPGNYFD
jgi:hypothetical protein